jgi:hypothetical protein
MAESLTHTKNSGELTPRATLRQVCSSWLATKRPETSLGIQDFYGRSVKILLTGLLREKADLPVNEIPGLI